MKKWSLLFFLDSQTSICWAHKRRRIDNEEEYFSYSCCSDFYPVERFAQPSRRGGEGMEDMEGMEAWREVHFRSSIWVGPGWWGPWGYPYYYSFYSYSYPYYAEPPILSRSRHQFMYSRTSQQEESDYWYFCTKPQGYYPYIKRCPGGWLKVVPSAPPDR